MIFYYRVNRGCYNKLNQKQLSIFAQLVLSKVLDNPVYVDITAQITDLKAKSDIYAAALLAAGKGGTELVKLKNLAKDALKVSFNMLSNAVELYTKDNPNYIVDTGLALREKNLSSTVKNERPKTPVEVVAASTGKVGELAISFVLPNGKHVVAVACEYRVVGTEQFFNGTYFTGTKGVMRGLPSLSMVEVRFKALGRDSLSSDWTTVIAVPVL